MKDYANDPQLVDKLRDEADIQYLPDEIADMNDLKADGVLRIVKGIENEIKYYEEQKEQMVSFYEKKIDAKKSQISYLTHYTFMAMDQMEKKTWSLPTGTFRRTVRTSPVWSDDDVLVAFALENKVDIKVTEKPDKTKLKKYIKETGVFPDGYDEEVKISYSYKLNEEK